MDKSCVMKKKNYPENSRPRKIQLCWECQNALGGWSWSKNFTPVPGWKAKKVYLRHATRGWLDRVETYKVIECPEFRKDKKKRKAEWLEENEMELKHADYIKRERMIMGERRSQLTKMRDGLSGSMPDVVWLKTRLTYVIQEMNIRISALDKEIADNEFGAKSKDNADKNADIL